MMAKIAIPLKRCPLKICRILHYQKEAGTSLTVRNDRVHDDKDCQNQFLLGPKNLILSAQSRSK